MKTAVKWLIDELRNKHGLSIDLYSEFEQAKEMEKEQIVNAHFDGCEIGEIFAYENREFITDSEQYYNKTFKQ
jgi:hypothetical protein